MVEPWQGLSVLIVGCGSIGKRHARVLKSLGVADIRACDPVPGQRESLLAQVPSTKLYASYDVALKERPDTVLVCTPPQLHIPMAMQAIQAGCHVLCEKPLSDTTEGIDELSSLADERQKKIMVALCFRFHEGLVKAKHYLESGRVGRLAAVRALVGEHLPDARPDYRSLFSTGFYGVFDLMHEIDLAIWYASQPVRQVVSCSGAYGGVGVNGIPDLAEIIIDFEGLCMGSVHLDFFQRPRRRQTELICTHGVIIVEFARWDRCTVSVYEAAREAWEYEELITDRDDMFWAEDREFLQAVAEDKPIACTVAEGRKSVEVVMAAQRES